MNFEKYHFEREGGFLLPMITGTVFSMKKGYTSTMGNLSIFWSKYLSSWCTHVNFGWSMYGIYTSRISSSSALLLPITVLKTRLVLVEIDCSMKTQKSEINNGHHQVIPWHLADFRAGAIGNLAWGSWWGVFIRYFLVAVVVTPEPASWAGDG